jgi:hypothetical protein
MYQKAIFGCRISLQYTPATGSSYLSCCSIWLSESRKGDDSKSCKITFVLSVGAETPAAATFIFLLIGSMLSIRTESTMRRG